MRHARWPIVDYSKEHNIVWIEDDCDANGSPKMSITNDAENVFRHFRGIYGSGVRVVYRDTDMEWWEIVQERTSYNNWALPLKFKRWHGLAWDILSN